MENYLIFVMIATLTVLSPGPGVLLTLTNALRYGVGGAFGGILGIAFGTFVVAGVSATSLGMILAASSVAFTVMKFLGAAYLIYLGVKLWRAPVIGMQQADVHRAAKPGKFRTRFLEGLTLQLTNPKAVFFFMSIFPQFIDYSSGETSGYLSGYVSQFVLLVLTYSLLVVVLHLLYAHLAKSARAWFSSDKGGRIVNRVGGATFLFFGVGLASATK
ncbi:LysE family translocator [Hahella ganghwensis]|uniref:LysE family translocator n=1 Tax=Hahella ganghwensis TaxID=286420 RepID=UPI00036D8491|nr:LysE family translocator [Hahella ganghwensis]